MTASTRGARREDGHRPDVLGRGGAEDVREHLRWSHGLPESEGVWRDSEKGGTLVFDDTVVVQCYTTPKDVQTPAKMKKVAAFCDRMRVEAKQGEVGLVIADEYFAFRNFKETTR